MKVLIPLDGSERSLAAAKRASEWLRDADITLFCVQNEGFDDAPEDVVEMFDEDEDDEVFPTADSAQRMLDEAAEALGGCKTVKTKGNVRKEIVKAAKKYDLVVMHALDKSGLKEKFKMSGTEWLARNVGCAVLLVDD